MPTITVKISKKTGNIVTDFNGFEGSSCIATAEKMLRGLKAKGVEVHLDTFHSKVETGEQVHIFEEALTKAGK